MVKVLFERPCHVPLCLINEEGGSSTQKSLQAKIVSIKY